MNGHPHAPAHPLLADAWVAATVDDALAPFEDLLPSEELRWMRERLAEHLEEDPMTSALLAGARPRVVDDSGERILRGVDGDSGADASADPARKGGEPAG